MTDYILPIRVVMRVSEIYEKYGISREEVLKWAEKTYPQFLNNEGVLAQLYLLQVKRVKLDPSAITVMRGKEVTIDELKVGEWCIIKVLIGVKVRENIYSGCPNCMKKTDGEYCPSCGKVEPVTHRWISYVGGDNTGDIIITFPPRIANQMKDLTGKVLRIRGVLNEDGEFLANQVQEVSKPSGSFAEVVEKKIEEAEVEKLKGLLSIFTNISFNELKQWHTTNNMKTPLEDLIDAAGYEVVGEKVVPKGAKEAEKPTSEKPTEAKEEEKEAPKEEREEEAPEEETPEADPTEVENLKKLLSVFPEVKYDELKEWHRKLNLKTPLDALIKAAGGKVVEGKVIGG